MTELKPIKEGKVREIYDNGDSLIMVATDRISCFDVILKNQVICCLGIKRSHDSYSDLLGL